MVAVGVEVAATVQRRQAERGWGEMKERNEKLPKKIGQIKDAMNFKKLLGKTV